MSEARLKQWCKDNGAQAPIWEELGVWKKGEGLPPGQGIRVGRKLMLSVTTADNQLWRTAFTDDEPTITEQRKNARAQALLQTLEYKYKTREKRLAQGRGDR